MRQAARMYFETQVTTTSKGQVLIMLYDGAIKFLTQAKERIEAKDYPGKGILISNAIDVINELASSLNAEKGGDLAANLSQLYFYCNKRLFMANSRMDTAAIDEVIKILGGIRSAYAQILDSPEAVAAMANAPQPVGNAMRAPACTQAAPTNGAPVAKARVHSAYATQGAAAATEPPPGPAGLETGATEPSGQAEPAALASQSVPAAPPVLAAEIPQATAEKEPVAKPAPLPALDLDDAPPPSLTLGKKMATSGLYKKFAS